MNDRSERTSPPPLARNVRRLGHLDLPGAGQVTVAGSYAYVGHIPNKSHLGTSIIDISDPRNPRVVAQVMLDDRDSHSHKVRVAGDIMIVNHERNMTAIGRRADELPRVRRELAATLGREPTRGGDRRAARRHRGRHRRDRGARPSAAITTAASRSTTCPIRRSRRRSCTRRPAASACIASTWTSATPTSRPRWRAMSATSWSSTTSAIRKRPAEVSRWWMPGQHIAGGETPTWPGRQHRLHHALRFGNEMWASCWHGGFRIVDVSDLAKPQERSAATTTIRCFRSRRTP